MDETPQVFDVHLTVQCASALKFCDSVSLGGDRSTATSFDTSSIAEQRRPRPE
jgi:hypothetical protein